MNRTTYSTPHFNTLSFLRSFHEAPLPPPVFDTSGKPGEFVFSSPPPLCPKHRCLKCPELLPCDLASSNFPNFLAGQVCAGCVSVRARARALSLSSYFLSAKCPHDLTLACPLCAASSRFPVQYVLCKMCPLKSQECVLYRMCYL
jgi:hypothetical protein